MTNDRIDDTPFNAHNDHELTVGAGASIMVAVAASLVIVMTVLFASLAPAHAAESPAAIAFLDDSTGVIHPLDAAQEFGRDMSFTVAPETERSQSLAMIVLAAVLAGWAAVTADLWRALFNRVKSWDRLGS